MTFKHLSSAASGVTARVAHDLYMLIYRHAWSPWRHNPRWRLERSLIDWLHTGPLGTLKDLGGSALIILLEHGVLPNADRDPDA